MDNNYKTTFITIDEFKASPLYDTNFDSDHSFDSQYINQAIEQATMTIDYLSGGRLLDDFNKVDDKGNPLVLTQGQVARVKTGNVLQVLWLLRNSVSEELGQGTDSYGGVSHSFNAPSDPYYIVAYVSQMLKELGYLGEFKAIPNIEAESFGNGLDMLGAINLTNTGEQYITVNQALNKLVNVQGGIVSKDGSVKVSTLGTARENGQVDLSVDVSDLDGANINISTNPTITSINSKINVANQNISNNSQNIITNKNNIGLNKDQIANLETSKQDKLTAGTNIRIDDQNVISAIIDIPEIDGNNITATINGTPNVNMAGAITQNSTDIATNKTDIANIDNLIATIQKQLTPWVIGEYKWTKQNVSMPNGWSKVDLPSGYTLTQNSDDKTQIGVVQQHQHALSKNSSCNFGAISKGKSAFYTLTIDHSTNNTFSTMAFDTGAKVNNVYATDYNNGTKENFAAGLNAQLWVYVGVENGETNQELANQWNAEIQHSYKVAMELQAKKEQEMNTKQEPINSGEQENNGKNNNQ